MSENSEFLRSGPELIGTFRNIILLRIFPL
jgi:hypothetical protein